MPEVSTETAPFAVAASSEWDEPMQGASNKTSSVVIAEPSEVEEPESLREIFREFVPLIIGVVLVILGVLVIKPWNFFDVRFALGGLLIGAGVRAIVDWLDEARLPVVSTETVDGESEPAEVEIPLRISVTPDLGESKSEPVAAAGFIKGGYA
jgi:hypothetical protein